MKSSVSSSATAPPPPPAQDPHSAAPQRKTFALTGPSVTLDPRTHAVRADLADVRLAERVFAPHYAEAVHRTLVAPATLRSARGADAEALTQLAAGDRFELLDLIGDSAWGIAPAAGLVGYLPANALGNPA